MEALPESCLARVFAYTAPRDVCRLSATSKTFNDSANSDFVWDRFLPSQCWLLLSRTECPEDYQSMSKRELYFRLCRPIPFDKGTKLFWIDQATGKLCYMLSARGLYICWGEDERYWRWVAKKNSSFKDVAALMQVCWFEVQGEFDCNLLSPGTEYTVSFRLRLQKWPNSYHNPYLSWSASPTKFRLRAPNKEDQHSARYLARSTSSRYPTRNADLHNSGIKVTSSRDLEDGWTEYDVGTYVVGEDGANTGIIEFSMLEVEGGNWKTGVLVDGAAIHPTLARKNGKTVQEEQHRTHTVRLDESSEEFQSIYENMEQIPDIWNF